jgi:site-specific recombinase XerD
MQTGYQNPTAFRVSVAIVLYGNAPTDSGATMYDVILFKHEDRRSPNYYAIYKHPITGKNCSFSCRTPDRAQAQAYAVAHLPKILRQAYDKQYNSPQPEQTSTGSVPRTTAVEPITVRQFAERYVAEHRTKRGRHFKAKSRKAVLDSFNQFIKYVRRSLGLVETDEPYLHMVTPAICKDFILAGQQSDRTAQKHHINLRSASDWAIREKYIEKNFFRDFDAPIPEYTDEQIEERCFSDEDFTVLFGMMPTKTYAQRRLRNILVLAGETGMRLGELRHIKNVWYDLNRKYIKIKSDRAFSPKTKSSSRTIPLSDNALAVIRLQLADNARHSRLEVRESNYLFPNQLGTPLSEAAIENPFRELRKQVFGNRRITIHGRRHAFVTRLSLAGASDRIIQDMTGQETLATIQRYSHMGTRLVEPIRDVLNQSPRLDFGSPTSQE